MTIMRICLTWFPIGLFSGNQYITLTRLIYKKNGKVVEEICTRIDGCRIIDNVCVDCLTVNN